jgi:hypothetical protein
MPLDLDAAPAGGVARAGREPGAFGDVDVVLAVAGVGLGGLVADVVPEPMDEAPSATRPASARTATNRAARRVLAMLPGEPLLLEPYADNLPPTVRRDRFRS